jgi:hypothetical protein
VLKLVASKNKNFWSKCALQNKMKKKTKPCGLHNICYIFYKTYLVTNYFIKLKVLSLIIIIIFIELLYSCNFTSYHNFIVKCILLKFKK